MDTAALSNLLDDQKVRVDMEEKEKWGTCDDNHLPECGVDLALKLLYVLNEAHTVGSVQHHHVVGSLWDSGRTEESIITCFLLPAFEDTVLKTGRNFRNQK